MDSVKDIIEDIRKNEYGIGLKTDPAVAKVLEKSFARTNRALERLSDELYTKDTHFVLELIQNADDNQYQQAIEPLFRFEIDDRKILVQNNETGFGEDNVRALCDVGKTTKSKRHGYIGEKGIGFKSVFLVTNEPHIYSRGFRFKFKRKDEKDKLGFIIPHWLDEIPNYVDQTLTNIVLPLREDIKEEILKFKDLEPTIILFLNKLKVIEVFNKIEGSISKITRKDPNGHVEIEHAKGSENWLLLKKNIKDPPKEEKREGISESELILAYPLKPEGTANTSNKQKIFAYLPTRGHGFKFIIQADFLVPSNREDIRKDKPWNKWIRNNIPSAFMNSLKKFKTDPNLSKTYYNFIPLVGDISDDFFEPTAKQIINKLRNVECMLTESGTWAKPSKIFYADKNFRNLISNDDCKKAFSQEYLNKGVVVKREILKALKVKDFSLKHLLVCLNNKELVKAKDNKWFTELYAFLNEQELSKEQIDHIKQLRIFQLKNGQLASLSEGPIFFPLAKRQEYGFENELRIIKSKGYKEDEKIAKSAEEFLKSIGIRKASPYEIIEEHILPIYENDSWKEKSNKELHGYVRYIRDNLDSYQKEKVKPDRHGKSPMLIDRELTRLKKCLRIRVQPNDKDEEVYKLPQDLYLMKDYGTELDLKKLLRGIEGIHFIHNQYISKYQAQLQKKTKKKTRKKIEKKVNPQIERWKDFFLKIGVKECLIVKKDPDSEEYEGARYAGNRVTKKIVYEHLKKDSIWKDEKWKETEYQYYIRDDWLCHDFEKIVNKIESHNEVEKGKIYKALLQMFVNNWDYYKKYLTCKYFYRFYHQAGWSSKETPSTFLLTLKKNSWVPTENDKLVRPDELFQAKPEIKSVLGDTVDYLAIEIDDDEFINGLGIRPEASVGHVVNYLKGLIIRRTQDKSTFQKIYKFVASKFEGNEEFIRESFKKDSLIFIPDSEQKFFNSKQVIWKDVSEIFGTNKGYLEKNYPKLKGLFVDKLQISVKPNAEDYANTLVDISNKEKILKKEETIIKKIYKELDTQLNLEINENLISEEDWWDDFISKDIFWTEKDKFWKNENDIFIADNDEFNELFKDNEIIAFLKIPKNYHPKIKHFLKTARINLISQAVKAELEIKEEPILRIDLTKQIRLLIRYILRYLYQKEHSIYQRLKDSEKISEISSIKCSSLKTLKVSYSVMGSSVSAEIPAILHEGNLYIQEEAADTDYLAIELAKLFGNPKGLDDFIGLLFSKKTEEKIETFMRAKGIQELPEEESEINVAPQEEDLEEEVVKQGQKGDEAPEERKSETQPAIGQETQKAKTGTGQTSEPQEQETVEWEQECEPEEAETNIKQYNGETEQATTRPPTTRTARPVGQTIPAKDPDEKKDMLSPEAKKAIGNWGEEYALKCIKEELAKKYKEGQIKDTEDGFIIIKNGDQITEVKWLNKDYDQGIGCDIEIVENGIKFYVEVKSTKTDKKEWFDVSRKQWEMIGEHGDKYIIYRVYNAGKKKEARSKRIDDPARLWLEGTIKAYPVRIKI